MKKRLLALGLCLTMVLGCVACGGGSKSETKAAESTQETEAAGQNIRRFQLMLVMRIFSNSTQMTVLRNHVLQIHMNSAKMERH